MPPGGRSRRACGGGYAAGLPRPWPGGRAQLPQQERKVGYLRAGARPRALPLPSPVLGHQRSWWEFGAPGSPAKGKETDKVSVPKKVPNVLIQVQKKKKKVYKIPYQYATLLPTCSHMYLSSAF